MRDCAYAFSHPRRAEATHTERHTTNKTNHTVVLERVDEPRMADPVAQSRVNDGPGPHAGLGLQDGRVDGVAPVDSAVVAADRVRVARALLGLEIAIDEITGIPAARNVVAAW